MIDMRECRGIMLSKTGPVMEAKAGHVSDMVVSNPDMLNCSIIFNC